MAMNEVTPVYDVCGKNDDGMMGGGMWIFFLFILLLFRGNDGFGGGNNTETFALNNVERKLDGISNGLCDGIYALNNSIKDCCCTTQLGMANGFAGVEKGLCDLSYKVQDCCCETNRNIDASRFEAQRNTCDIIQAGNANTQRIIDFLTTEKIDGLRQELQTAQLRLSQVDQTDEIINRIKPCPIPSYPVCPPCTPYNPCGTV